MPNPVSHGRTERSVIALVRKAKADVQFACSHFMIWSAHRRRWSLLYSQCLRRLFSALLPADLDEGIASKAKESHSRIGCSARLSIR